jgi:nitroreductase
MNTHSNRRAFLKRGALISGGLLAAGCKAAMPPAATKESNPPVAADSSPLTCKFSPAPAAEAEAEAQANIWDVIQHRRSVRDFRPDAVPDEDIRRIIDAARLAPTSGNQQPWKFLVVRDKRKIDELKEACVKRALEKFDSGKRADVTREQFESNYRSGTRGIFSAPVYIVVLTDNRSKYPDYNHWDGPLAAGYLLLAARALGYGTVHITDAIPDAVTKAVFRIPDNYTRVCITPLGIPVHWPDSPRKKGLEEFLAFETLG